VTSGLLLHLLEQSRELDQIARGLQVHIGCSPEKRQDARYGGIAEES
jgi:hypothetical protein